MGSLQSGAASQKPPRVVPFGKYLLLERLAVGGMAEVFLGKSFGIEGFERILAIKRILPTMAEDEDFIEMFIDEAKIAGHLNHANIVPIYELGKIGESHYIAMEYVWGKDLLQIMNRFRKLRTKMPFAMVIFIATRMCEALAYAHGKRDRRGNPLDLVHRDVSPQNILVSYEGTVKLIDFGIAKAASRTTKTQAGVLKGKFGYMSPEQVRGLPIDHRSDLFAVGTCMYEMLTAERLFVGESDFSTLERVRHADVPPLEDLRPDVPPELAAVVMKALTRETNDRYKTAGQLQEALQELAAQERPPFTATKLAGWMQTAFAEEQETEKRRLDGYANVGRESVEAEVGAAEPRPRRPSSVPPPPSSAPPRVPSHPPPPTAEALAGLSAPPQDEELSGDATMITASPFDELLMDGPEDDALDGEPTQIFFSSDELDDPRGVAGPIVGGGGAFEPPPPSVEAEPREDPAAPAPVETPARKRVGAETMDLSDAPTPLPLPAPKKRRAGGTPWVLGAAAAMLLLALGVGAAFLLLGGDDVGRITVATRPDVGAELRLDGVAAGTVRGRLTLPAVPAGTHVLEVEAPGFQLQRKEVLVQPEGDSQFELLLIRQTPPVASPPVVQEPVVDEPAAEEPAPPAAPTTETRAAAPPTMTARARDATPTMSVASARPRMAATRPAAPAPSMSDARPASRERGNLVVNSMPLAEVFVNGRRRGRTPVPRLPVPAGRHTVELLTSDGRTHTQTVEVEPGGTARVIHRF
ncbi:MAG: protein kinase [Myxococcota bacterium]